MSIGGRIALLRARRGLSLQKLADLVGCTKTHIWDLERGHTSNPTLSTAINLSRELGCSLSYLAGVHEVLPDYDPAVINVAALMDAALRSRGMP